MTDEMNHIIGRRKFLSLAGGATATALAGCSTDSESGRLSDAIQNLQTSGAVSDVTVGVEEGLIGEYGTLRAHLDFQDGTDLEVVRLFAPTGELLGAKQVYEGNPVVWFEDYDDDVYEDYPWHGVLVTVTDAAGDLAGKAEFTIAEEL